MQSRIDAEAKHLSNDPSRATLLGAEQSALNQLVNARLDVAARLLASRMSFEDLRVVAGFLAEPAGRAWVSARQEADDVFVDGFLYDLGEASRKESCLAKPNCGDLVREKDDP
jgi:hypothetical protein